MGLATQADVTGPIEEQPSLWQQSDLLSLVAQPKQVVALDPSPSNSDLNLRSDPINLLILDTETTGLEPVSAQCIEVGAVLFHVPTRSVLSQVSFLLPAAANPAEHVNGIAAEVTRLPQPWQAGLKHFLALLADADAVLAHNAAFDAKWFGLGPLPPVNKPWICSMDDIEWPPERHLRPAPSVRDLALAYGVPVWAAHRALTDCTYLVQVLERCGDLEGLLAAAMEPKLLYRANLPYAERHKAKQAGFRWNEPVRGAWSRRLSERQAQALAFEVQRVEADSEAA
jgi:DNA polymerase III subunit epsilon